MYPVMGRTLLPTAPTCMAYTGSEELAVAPPVALPNSALPFTRCFILADVVALALSNTIYADVGMFGVIVSSCNARATYPFAADSETKLLFLGTAALSS